MDIDPALLRGLTQQRLSRRAVVRGAGIGVGAISVQAFLAACSVKGTSNNAASSSAPAAPSSSAAASATASSSAATSAAASASATASATATATESASATAAADSAVSEFWAQQKLGKTLNFANWPLYIDQEETGGKVVRPSLDAFTKETGIKVNYKEVIQDNGSFFGVQQPVLAAGKDTGYDLMVISNGVYLTKLISLGYLIELDPKLLPNFAANADKSVQNPNYDPGNRFTVPWQSGLTGIAYDPEKTKREITSFNDLFDPAFKGKVGMMGNTQDLPNLALVGLGIDPAESTPADWQKAADKLKEQRAAKMVRKYYESDYIDPLVKGDIWLSMAWSGDAFQASDKLKFVVPEEGGLIWTDNMCIPAKAKHPLDAITYMDYVYQPEVAATIAEYVNYITPVPAAREVVKSHAAAAKGDDKAALDALASSSLIFPSAKDLERVYRFRVLTPAEEKEWNSIFEPIYQS